LKDCLEDLFSGRRELRLGDDFVYEPDFPCARRGENFPALEVAPRPARADGVDHVRADRRWRQAERHFAQGEARAFRGDDDVRPLALDLGIDEIADVGCREIVLSDADFADWPLSDRVVLECLTRWAQKQRKLTLLAQSFDELARRHGRWVEWRRQWSHVVECRANTELEAAQVPSVLLAPGLLVVRRIDVVRYRGSVSPSGMRNASAPAPQLLQNFTSV